MNKIGKNHIRDPFKKNYDLNIHISKGIPAILLPETFRSGVLRN